jgi:hypothetical protein
MPRLLRLLVMRQRLLLQLQLQQLRLHFELRLN